MATQGVPNYYEGIKWNYQPYNYANTPFAEPGALGAGGSNYYPTFTQNEPNSGVGAFAPTTPPAAGANSGTAGGQTTAAGGLFQGPNWLYQPQEAVIRAMRQAGYNPASFNPVSQQILRNAGNFAASLFNQSVGQGTEQMPDLTDNSAMLNRLQALIQQGASGAKVFGGVDPSQMARYSEAVAASNAGTANPSQNVIAEYLYDPTRALNLATSLLYSGLAPQFQRAAAAPLANLSDYYQRLLEQGQDYNRTILDVLLGAPVAGHAPGTMGVPLPFQASAWRYNP